MGGKRSKFRQMFQTRFSKQLSRCPLTLLKTKVFPAVIAYTTATNIDYLLTLRRSY